MTAAERKSDIKLTTDAPYLTLTGELYSVHIAKIWEKIYHVIPTLHCMYFQIPIENGCILRWFLSGL